MGTTENQLKNLLREIDITYTHQTSIHLKDKYTTYQKLRPLVDESKRLIEELQKEIAEIKNLDTTSNEQSVFNYRKIFKLIELLSSPHLKFDEIASCISEIKLISSVIPDKPAIHENVEESAIYEVEDVEDFD